MAKYLTVSRDNIATAVAAVVAVPSRHCPRLDKLLLDVDENRAAEREEEGHRAAAGNVGKISRPREMRFFTCERDSVNINYDPRGST